MNSNQLYDEAIIDEHKATRLILVFIMVFVALIVFAAFSITEPLFNIEVQILKNILFGTAGLIFVGAFIPVLFIKKKEMIY